MDEIEVDFKLVIKTIFIAMIIGTVLWLGYNLYIALTKDENEGVENFDGDLSSSKIESLGSKESDLIDEDYFIQPNIDKKFEINNENYLKTSDEWGVGRFGDGAGVAEYSFPPTFNELMGISLDTAVLDMANWTEDGTYEDFLEDFTDEIRYKNILEEAEYKTRPLNIGGKEFQIVVIETEYIVGSYFCLAKDGYAYCLQAIIPKVLYTEHWEQNIDKIFSTFTIL